MTEEEILDQHCKTINNCIRTYIDRNDQYSYGDMEIDIRAEVQEAMRKAQLLGEKS